MKNLIENYLDEVLDSSLSLSPNSVYWLHKNGQIVFANNNALDTLGYNLDELQNLMLWDVDAHVDTKEKYFEAIGTFIENDANGLPNIIQSMHKKKNGELFPVEVISKFKTIDGVEYIISYAKDITRRLKRDEDIELYFELINSTKDMLFLVDHKTQKIEFVNQIVCETLGYSLDEMKEKKVSEFRKPFDYFSQKLETSEVFKKAVEQNDMITFGVYHTKNGHEIPVETAVQFRQYKGKNYIIAISRDISERIKIELEREELNKKLFNYNKTLQEEIEKAKDQLIEYQDVMRKQSRMAAMGETLENIAHQWRQPLSVISTLTTGMIFQEEHNLADKNDMINKLNNINEQTQYLSKTIDDFRNFFKPTQEKKRFKVKDLIEKSIKLVNVRYNMDVVYETDIEDMEVFTYENEFLQLLINIFANALDELSKIEYEKYISTHTFKENEYLVLQIKDNAGGIDEDKIERVFEPYYTTKDKSTGTGIGLYMSKNIISHMNGQILAKNVEIKYNNKTYKSACFEIKIPL